MSLILSKVQNTKDWEAKLLNHEWVPFSEVKPADVGLDWVLVQFVEKTSGFVGLPFIAEYVETKKEWMLHDDSTNTREYVNKDCFASSWKIIEESPEWLAWSSK